MTPSSFRTAASPIHRHQMRRRARLNERESAGIVTLWMEALQAVPAQVREKNDCDGTDWSVWRYKNTLMDD